MSLKDLTSYISEQEKVISELPQEMFSETEWSKYWRSFRDPLWGKELEASQGLEDVQRGLDPVEDVVLPERHMVTTFPVALPPPWGGRHISDTGAGVGPGTDAATNARKILVRSEYEEAEREGVSSSKVHDVFAVSGQPGIGKSIFLAWLLVRRLTLKLPTVLQIHRSSAILFYEGGVAELTDREVAFSYRELVSSLGRQNLGQRRIWAIVDLGPQLQEPTGIFTLGSPFFVVNGMSPGSKQEWHRKVHRRRFFMKPWSISEMLQARPFFSNNLTEHQLWDFYSDFRPSPRAMVLFARHPDDYAERVREAVRRISPDGLLRAIRDPESPDSTHIIITILPSPASRHSFEVDFASRRVFEMIWEKHIHSRIDDMAYLYDLFSASKTSAAVAEWIFEFRMHQLLRSRRTVQLFPILNSGKGPVSLTYNNHVASLHQNDLKTLELLPSAEYPLTETTKVEKDCYYHPVAEKFPTIDSLLLVHPPGEPLPILLMFQITRSGEHDVKIEGLRKVDNLHFSTSIKKYYVVVTPESIRPQITVPIEYFEKDKGVSVDAGESADEEFSVFHYPVRPDGLFRKP